MYSPKELDHFHANGIFFSFDTIPVDPHPVDSHLFKAVRNCNERNPGCNWVPSTPGDLNYTFESTTGLSLLGAACVAGNRFTVDLLLRNEASPLAKDAHGRLPIAFALDRPEIVSTLIEAAPSLTQSEELAYYFSYKLHSSQTFNIDVADSLELVLEKNPSFVMQLRYVASRLGMDPHPDAKALMDRFGPPPEMCVAATQSLAFQLVQSPDHSASFVYKEGKFPDKLRSFLPDSFDGLKYSDPLSMALSHSTYRTEVEASESFYNEIHKACGKSIYARHDPVLKLLCDDIADIVFDGRKAIPQRSADAELVLLVGPSEGLAPHIDSGITVVKTYTGLPTEFYSPLDITQYRSFHVSVREGAIPFTGCQNRSVVFRGDKRTSDGRIAYGAAHSSPERGKSKDFRIMLALTYNINIY